MTETTPHPPLPTREEIEACAYFIYLCEGQPEGRALDHWLQAELQLLACRLHEAGTAEKKDTG